MSRASATPLTLPIFMPLRMGSPCIRALASPTPIIAPISVWELEAGIPLYQVPTFQVIAAIRMAKIMAVPALDPTLTKRSTGSKCTTANATPTPPRYTPIKLQMPESRYGPSWAERVGIDYGGYGVGGIVKAIYRLKRDRDHDRCE